MKKTLLLMTLSALAAFWSGCSENQGSQPSKSHPRGWAKPSGSEWHGAKVMAAGSESCTSCHGSDFNGGTSQTSCYKCHASYPHPAEWDEAQQTDKHHGRYLAAAGYETASCTPCHGEDLQNSEGKKPCMSCHTLYPHASGWMDEGNANFHGRELAKFGYAIASCTSCHATEGADVDGKKACKSCHTLFPHDTGWMTPEDAKFHGAWAKKAGWDLSACKSCHGDQFQGGEGKASCYTCHATFPHKEGWNNPANSGYHGAYLAGKAYKLEECQTCHGSNFQGGDGKAACNTCHASYPHVTGFKNDQNSAQFHGTTLKSAGYDLSGCSACHGADFQGGTSKQSCFKCHTSYPHNSAWLNPADSRYHGAYVAGKSYQLAECQACHGSNFQGGDGKSSCYTCHSSYPHSSAFKNETSAAQFHGVQLKAGGYALTACAACHGADYKGGTSGKSCYTCHSSYPHDAAWNNPSAATSHIGFLRGHGHDLQPCQSCHGADYNGGTSGKTCNLCHSSSGGPENCTLCHGSSDGVQPPKDTQGRTDESAMGVGRHEKHVKDKKYTCVLCHTYPARYSDPGHVLNDATPGAAEVLSLWQWNRTTATCVTGCHANDPGKSYIWNQ